MTLTNPTDDQINIAVAEKVAGWQKHAAAIMRHWSDGTTSQSWGWITPDGTRYELWAVPNYSRSLDAVMPLLQGHECWSVWQAGYGLVYATVCSQTAKSHHPARAACIALLRANGVEVVEENQ